MSAIQMTTILRYTFRIWVFKLFVQVNICILTLLLNVSDIASHLFKVLFVVCLPEDGRTKAEICNRFTTRLYIIVCNYGAVVDIQGIPKPVSQTSPGYSQLLIKQKSSYQHGSKSEQVPRYPLLCRNPRNAVINKKHATMSNP